MKLSMKLSLIILVFLALSSGLSKIFLMPQDVAFFGQYGFTETLLIIYGSIQFIGGVLMILPKTRIIGSMVVGTTFIISLIVLMMSGNIGMSLFTLVFVALLVFVFKETKSNSSK